MRALYIISIVVTFFFIFIMAAGTVGTKEERNRHYDRMLSSDSYGYDSYEYGDPEYVTSTYIAVGISMGYFVWAYLVFICSLAIVKTKTSKVLSIIAISMTTLMLAWGVMAMAEPRSISFDEIGGAWIFYGLVMLVFSIIGTVQAFRYHSQKNNPQPLPGQFQQAYANPFLQPQYQQPNPYQQQQQQNPYSQPYYPPFDSYRNPQQQQQPPFPQQQQPPFPQQNPYQQNPPYNQPNPYQQNQNPFPNPQQNQPPFPNPNPQQWQPPQPDANRNPPPQPDSSQDPSAPQPPADSPRNPWAPPQ